MADPTTALTAISLGGSMLGGVLGAEGAKTSADASANMYKYKAGVARVNSQIEQSNAEWALMAGESKGMQAGLEYAQRKGGILTTQGASGFDVNAGSNTRVRDSEGTIAQYDQSNIAVNAKRESQSYQNRAYSAEAEAGLADMGATNAQKAGDIGVMSSILGGATSVANKWLQAKNAGALGSTGGEVGIFDKGWGSAPTFWPTYGG